MGFYFGLDDVKIAPWTNPQVWGSAVDLVGAQSIELELNTVNGMLEGDDQIVDAHAKIISGSFTARWAFRDLAVYTVLTGETVDDSAAVDALTFDTSNMPYFGICGRILDTDGSGDLHLFMGKCKLMEAFTIGGQYGQFLIPQLSGTIVREGDLYGVARFFQHATAQAITIPPT